VSGSENADVVECIVGYVPLDRRQTSDRFHDSGEEEGTSCTAVEIYAKAPVARAKRGSE